MAGLITTLALVGATLLGVAPAGAASPVGTTDHDEPTRGQGAAWTPSTTRPTTLGRVRGLEPSAGSYSWLGVPYAEPPTGRLRWRPPVTHRRWDGVRRTTAYGDGCMQPGRMFSPSPDGPHYDGQIRDGLGTPVGSEDCLTLNVFRPATAERDLPVILFVHGGSNTVGYSADPLYDGRHLARQADAVVVTVNYRLGLFGWLNHEGLKDGGPVADSGNFGTLDIIESLRFVHRNARTFGGDPGNVTAMGESAGAVNVWSLLVSPLTKGLVHKAVPMSGGLSFAPQSQGRTYADQLATYAVDEEGTPSDSEDPIRLMRSLSAEDLQALALRHPELGANPPAVFPDGAVVPEDPYGAIAAGDYRKGPVLAGNTLEEGKLFGSLIGAYAVDDRRRFTLMHRSRPYRPSGLETSDLIAGQFLPVDRPGGWNDAAEALTRGVFTQLTAESMGQLDAAGHRKLFYYQFAWDSEPEPWDEVYGSVHAMDLPFAFGNFGRSLFSFAYGPENKPGRRGLSALMIRSLERFVRTGDPGHAGLDDRWEQWPASTVFDATKRRASGTAGTFVPPDAGPDLAYELPEGLVGPFGPVG